MPDGLGDLLDQIEIDAVELVAALMVPRVERIAGLTAVQLGLSLRLELVPAGVEATRRDADVEERLVVAPAIERVLVERQILALEPIGEQRLELRGTEGPADTEGSSGRRPARSARSLASRSCRG